MECVVSAGDGYGYGYGYGGSDDARETRWWMWMRMRMRMRVWVALYHIVAGFRDSQQTKNQNFGEKLKLKTE